MSVNPQLIKVAEKLIDVAEGIAENRATPREPREDPFRDALRERTPLVFVTPLLVALNVAIFFFMAFKASGPLSDPRTLLDWGASFGPQTTNGGWWRLVASMFLHSGFLHLVVSMAGLLQAGLIVERLVGPVAIATTYLATGIVARLLGLSEDPLAVSFGSSAAIFGVYGLLAASFLVGLRQRSAASIPIDALKRLAPAAGIFFLYNLTATGQYHLAAFVIGFLSGAVLTIGATEEKAPMLRVAAVAGGALMAVGVLAVPLRGIADVRPEIALIAALEERTASAYDLAMLRFRNNRITRDGLAKVIDGQIMPDLTAARARLQALRGVPAQHRPIVASADEYLKLRQDSFRLRLEGLRKANMKTLQLAERKEIAAREALDKVKLD